MTDSKQCRNRFENIVGLIMGELNPHATGELQDHIAVCQRCREARDTLVEEEKEVRSAFEALACRLGPVERVLLENRQCQPKACVDLSNDHFHERVKSMILSHKRLSVAAATVMALAGSVILYVFLFPSSTDAYALEQTAQANNRVTSYHVKITPAAELGEAWIEMNPDGTPLRARMDLLSPDDGAKVVILSGAKAEVWFKDKKSHVFVTNKDALKGIMALRNIFDPKLAFEELQARKKADEVQVATKEPAKKGEPITLTVTSKKTPDRRAVYDVDPDTKLVKRVIDYRRRGDQWEQVGLREYLDYSKPIDPKIFQLELPKDVFTVDQINQKVGLVKGNLSDDEIATKLAKEFVEAIIADDFQKAGILVGGMPAEALKMRFQRAQVKFIRIVKIGSPKPNPKSRSVLVPVTVELEVNGKKMEKEL
ncbi:MAG: hypothetical protein QGH33_19020, partial [Pirellulaceae bacterium]|nr:hypothetical protein [Pirellulaceae bacterium]